LDSIHRTVGDTGLTFDTFVFINLHDYHHSRLK
jgi:hypothetical protein